MTLFRAPFIWTPEQPFAQDHLHAIRDLPHRDDGQNRWFLFRATLDLSTVPGQAATKITVDGRYQLFVNGVAVGHGPVRCSPLAQRYDTWDLAPYLTSGSNVIAVLVHTYGVDTAFYEGVRGLWRPVFGEGGLWLEGDVVDTRGEWRCLQTDAWVQDTPRANNSLGFIEWFDANKLPVEWNAPGFDDSGWPLARPLQVGGGGAEANYGGMIVRPFPILMPRGLPPMYEGEVRPAQVRWVKGQVAQTDLPFHLRLYDEALIDAPRDAAEGVEDLLGNGDASTVIRTSDGVDTAFTLDFGRIFSGYPTLEIEALGGEIVEIACSERLPGEWMGPVEPDARIIRFPFLGNDAHTLRYVARPGRQTFQRFERCVVRYMHVVVRNAPAGLRIRGLGAIETHYPVEQTGSFACSDPMLTTLWSVGAYTVKQCMQDAWEDCPSREQRQWLGDVTVESVAAWAAFGSSAQALTAKYLVQVAESQRPDGLTQMFAPGDHMHDARLIPDWTLQWILCAETHWNLTGDIDTIEAIWPSIQKALSWFERIAGDYGLVVDMPYWHFMDWAGLGRDHEALALNAQLAGSYRAAAVLAHALGFERAAADYEVRASSIVARLDAGHWDDRRGVWVDMVDPTTGEQLKRVSQHGVAALSLWGDVPPERVSHAFDWMIDPERETLTPGPPVVFMGTRLDEETGVVMANTFYGHFVGEALARHGRRDAALALIRRRFGPMIEAGSTTLWEATTPWASLCHGFSASPTWFLSRHILGVAPAAPGFAAIRVTPDLLDLDYAEGVVPAGEQTVKVSLARTDIGFDAVISVDGPKTVGLEVAAPRGLRMVCCDRDGAEVRATFARA